LEFLFPQAKDFGSQAKLIFDIGANHGGWTKIMLKVFPKAKFVLLNHKITAIRISKVV
jgi:hypothetical protein